MLVLVQRTWDLCYSTSSKVVAEFLAREKKSVQVLLITADRRHSALIDAGDCVSVCTTSVH